MFVIPENTTWLVLFIVFSTVALIQLLYYFLFYSRILYCKTEKKRGKKEAVSVIICARNEAENLKIYLPSMLEQEYPDYELIVVNDCSEDDSEDAAGTIIQAMAIVIQGCNCLMPISTRALSLVSSVNG